MAGEEEPTQRVRAPARDEPWIRVWDGDANHVQMSREGLFLVYTTGSATDANIASLVRNFDAFAHAHKGPIAFILQTTTTTRPPHESQRRQVTEMMERHADKLVAVAVCMTAAGFVGATLRAVASAVFGFGSRGHEVKVFADITSGLVWAANRAGVPVAYATGLSVSAVDYVESGSA